MAEVEAASMAPSPACSSSHSAAGQAPHQGLLQFLPARTAARALARAAPPWRHGRRQIWWLSLCSAKGLPYPARAPALSSSICDGYALIVQARPRGKRVSWGCR